MSSSRKRYTFRRFIWDLFLTCITGGLYLLWKFFKLVRNSGN
jgi:uncharacterized membrane protein YjgN (DUF898 family)